MIKTSAAEANEDETYRKALVELLYQLADDDFIIAYRGSEWLGLAPHIEEDIAFSSINQNTMGHANLYYELLEALGEGEASELAHNRRAEDFRCAIILEEKNGSGTYLKEPDFDWAFTVVRHYFYDVAKKIRLDSLQQSSYEPLADAARKIVREQYYHLMHWEVWFKQLTNAPGEGRARMTAAIDKVWPDFGGVLSLGPYGGDMAEAGLIEGEDLLTQRWMNAIKPAFAEVQLPMPARPWMQRGDGRAGTHTEHLVQALDTLSEVYRIDPATTW